MSGTPRAAVVGVYPSALHVRWTLPRWAVDKHGLEARIGALAVDNEPIVFWDGHDPNPDALVDAWKGAVGFREGDDDGQHGSVRAAMNGTSGRAVTDRILHPLGLNPGVTLFTDILPRFFVKSGSALRRQQADRIAGVYEPFAELTDLPPARLPARPTQGKLVETATKEEAARLRSEFQDVPLIITLGEEARRVVSAIADSAEGPPTSPLQRDADYGGRGQWRAGPNQTDWIALTHPGNRHKGWRKTHDRWMSEKAAWQ